MSDREGISGGEGLGPDYSVRMRECYVGEAHSGTGYHFQGGGEVHPAPGSQTRLVSLIESVVNVGSGFILSLILWQYIVAPAFGYEVTIGTNLILTSIFTVVSVARGYLWRRFFARDLHKAVVKFVQRFVQYY